MRSMVLGMAAAVAFTSPALCLEGTANNLPVCSGVTGAALDTRIISFPALGSESEVDIGQSMISALKMQDLAHGLRTTGEVIATGDYMGQAFELRIPAGTKRYLSEGRPGAVRIPGATFRYEREKQPRRGLSAPYVDLTAEGSGPHTATAVLSFGMSSQNLRINDPAIEVLACSASSGPSLRRELVYSGVSKGTVRLLYREFINDMARPAFSQDLTYDLADGDEIGFRGARFKVLKATNTSIRYLVIRSLQD